MKRLFTLLLLSFAALSCEMVDEKLDDFIGRDDSSVTTIANNQIWYTSVNGEVVEPYSGEDNNYADAFTTFGVNIVSNTYVDGKGVIEFEGDVTTIGGYAFYGCSNLTSVTIGDSVTTIGSYAFAGCENLEAVHITDLVSWCNIDFINPLTDGRVDLSANPLCYAHNLYLNGELVTDLVIPDGVNEIKLMAFALCGSIKSVTIPDSVTTIGDYAFLGCSSLASVTIGDSVTTIGDGAFWGCYSLTSVTIPDSVTTIGEYAFADCISLTSVTIPDSVTTIGNYAFNSCSSLTSVYCKATTPPVGGIYMFVGNASDRKIYVPMESVEAYKSASYWSDYADRIVAEEGAPEDMLISIIRYTTTDSTIVTPQNMNIKSNTYVDGEGVLEFYGDTIGDCAFCGCSNLTSVTIGDSVTEIGYCTFYFCDSLTSVTIPDSVTTIEVGAFYNCTSLTSVAIPDSVTTIGHSAFDDCSSLTSVYCKAITPPAGDDYMFSNNASGRKIYVPMESVEAYKSASYWRDYADDIVGYYF